MQVRVATYNLLHGIDLAQGGRVDLDRAAEAIAALGADVVAVQEVDRDLPRSGTLDQVAALGQRLDRHAAFAPGLLGDPDRAWRRVPDDDPGGPAYGVGLLSRWPLAALTRTALPGGGDGVRSPGASPTRPGWDREPRVALSATVDVEGRALRVTTTHLSYLPWRGLAQARVLGRAAAAARAGGHADAAVIAGDLNLPAWPVRLALARHWRHAGGAPTYPAWDPRMQVDQILYRGRVRLVAVEVGAAGPSDHLPLVVTLFLPRGYPQVEPGSGNVKSSR